MDITTRLRYRATGSTLDTSGLMPFGQKCRANRREGYSVAFLTIWISPPPPLTATWLAAKSPVGDSFGRLNVGVMHNWYNVTLRQTSKTRFDNHVYSLSYWSNTWRNNGTIKYEHNDAKHCSAINLSTSHFVKPHIIKIITNRNVTIVALEIQINLLPELFH